MFNLKKGGKMKKVPTFCITGALKMKRIDAIVMIHNKTNARFVSMVSKNTDYLIVEEERTQEVEELLADYTLQRVHCYDGNITTKADRNYKSRRIGCLYLVKRKN